MMHDVKDLHFFIKFGQVLLISDIIYVGGGKGADFELGVKWLSMLSFRDN